MDTHSYITLFETNLLPSCVIFGIVQDLSQNPLSLVEESWDQQAPVNEGIFLNLYLHGKWVAPVTNS